MLPFCRPEFAAIVARMGRKPRSYLPGAVFHLTARTQGSQAWFTPPLRTAIVGYLAAAVGDAAAALLAYVIMPNHLHLVLRQGQWPLGHFMQPLLRRIALLVQRSNALQGHVFERPYRDLPCLEPEHVRNAVVYTHLNPVRAGLVEATGDWMWSSHASYMAGNSAPPGVAPELAIPEGLRLFAAGGESTLEEMRATYGAYAEWRRRCDVIRDREERGEIGEPPPPPPQLLGSDLCWARQFAPLFSSVGSSNGHAANQRLCPAADPQQIALHTLAELDCGVPLEHVRSPYKGREEAFARRVVIRRMRAAGHRVTAIARYLRVSDQCVSAILRAKT